MKITKYLSLAIIVGLQILLCNTLKAAEESKDPENLYEITTQQPQNNLQNTTIFEPILNGQILDPNIKLPDGYEWLPNGQLKLPEDVILNKDGTLELPNNEYPPSYNVKPDGSVIAPNGVVINPKTPNQKLQEENSKIVQSPTIQNIEELLASIDEKYKELNAKEKKQNEKPITQPKEKPNNQNNEKPKDKKEKPKETEKPNKDKKPELGDKIQIPKDAMASGKLDFLEGCWKSGKQTAHTWDSNETHSIFTRICFDRNGRGQQAIQGDKGTYVGAVTGKIINNQLIIHTGRAYGGKKDEYYTPSDIICEGTGSTTQCKSKSVNPRNSRDIKYGEFELRRSL